MRNISSILAVVAAIVCLTASAQAGWITIQFTGTIESVYDPNGDLENNIQVSDPFIGFYTYNTQTPDLDSSPNFGKYVHTNAPAGISVNISGILFQTNFDDVIFSVEIENDTSWDSYRIQSHHNLTLPNGAFVDYISWQLRDSTKTALSGDELLYAEPDLGMWDSNSFFIGGRDSFKIYATIDDVVLVPEPITAVLFVAGLLGMKRFHG